MILRILVCCNYELKEGVIQLPVGAQEIGVPYVIETKPIGQQSPGNEGKMIKKRSKVIAHQKVEALRCLLFKPEFQGRSKEKRHFCFATWLKCHTVPKIEFH
jgi:hypothetical protein